MSAVLLPAGYPLAFLRCLFCHERLFKYGNWVRSCCKADFIVSCDKLLHKLPKELSVEAMFIELLSQINDHLGKCCKILLLYRAVIRMRYRLHMLCTGFRCWKTRAYWTTVLFKYWSDTLVVKSAALWTQSFIINLSCIWTASSRLGGLYILKRRLDHCIKYVGMSTSSILQLVLCKVAETVL